MIRLKNIILALLGFSPAMAACNDNDVVTNVNPEVKTGDVRIYATTTTLTRDLTVDYLDFGGKVSDYGWLRSCRNGGHMLQSVVDGS